MTGCGFGSSGSKSAPGPARPSGLSPSAGTSTPAGGAGIATSDSRETYPKIELVTTDDSPAQAMFEVLGLDDCEVIAIIQAKLSPEQWTEILSVRVVTDDSTRSEDRPAMIGAYRTDGYRIQFLPQFPLQPGLLYRAVLDRSKIPPRDKQSRLTDAKGEAAAIAPMVAEFSIPKLDTAATTVVVHVFPSGDMLPENQLKFYLHFSAPMSRGEAYQRIHMLDASGRQIELPFLELDEELWDPPGQRFTLLLDPGRIKRGLKPREEVGPVLEEGKSYTLVVDRDWLDARGNPLKEPHRKQFHAGPPDDEQPNPMTWKITPPAAETTDPLRINFPEPLDHAMLHRVISVSDSNGKTLSGEIVVDTEETRWSLVPATAWRAGEYSLVVQSALEDLAGNSIARLFDVDLLDPISKEMKDETLRVPFRVQRQR